MTNQYNEIIQRVNCAKRILITSHINPDGDSISSQLCLYEALIQLGKQVDILNQSILPDTYRFLPFAKVIKQADTICGNYDLVFVLDCGELERVGTWDIPPEAVIIKIDHHYQGKAFGAINFSDDKASSTAQLVYDLISRWPVKLTTGMATNIYVGIYTDTGGFRYHNASAESLNLASKLVKLGVQPHYVASKLYEMLPLSTISLLNLALSGLELISEGSIASIVISQKMLAQTKANPWETENFINFPKSIKGVEVALLFQEKDDGTYKVSLRSKEKTNVAELAKYLGGGGHYHAAGFKSNEQPDDIKNKITNWVTKNS